MKKVCRELLATLKREKLVLDWREKQQAQAVVMQSIKLEMRRLPSPYSRGCVTKSLPVPMCMVFDHYSGDSAGAAAI